MAENIAFMRKSGSRNTMMSHFRPEVEIWPHRACAMKNMQYNESSKFLYEQFGHCELGYGAVPPSQNVFLVIY